jgi:hypothetical protein
MFFLIFFSRVVCNFAATLEKGGRVIGEMLFSASSDSTTAKPTTPPQVRRRACSQVRKAPKGKIGEGQLKGTGSIQLDTPSLFAALASVCNPPQNLTRRHEDTKVEKNSLQKKLSCPSCPSCQKKRVQMFLRQDKQDEPNFS